MFKPRTVIYIPGLGDSRTTGQKLAIRIWYAYGVRPVMHRMMWHDSQSFDEKLLGLLNHIDALVEKGHTVSLVAVSAGATAALHAFAERADTLNGLVLICGIAHSNNGGHWSTNGRGQSFGQAIGRLPDALARLNQQQRRRILTVHPQADEQVAVKDTQINGAPERTIPVTGHFSGIAYGITLFAPAAIVFLKKSKRLLQNKV